MLGVCAALGAAVLLAGCSTGAEHPGPGADGPAAPLTGSPVTDALYRCITAHGWSVVLTDDGAIEAGSSTIPKEQYNLYLADTWACDAEVKAEYPVDDNQRHLLYAAELTERDCLVAKGYSVGDPPSLATFLDTYDSAPWSAMAASSAAARAETMPDAEWAAVNTACPQPVPGALK